jgi:hypothetical protein
VAWELIFMLLILKIPLVYMCLVVWWAVRSEPVPEEPAMLVPVARDPWSPRRFDPQTPRQPPRGPERRPHARRQAARASMRR